MFEDRATSSIDRNSVRESRSREDYEPTDNDAEVQVLSPIRAELILGAVVRNDEVKEALEELLGNIGRAMPVIVSEEFFS